MVSISAEAPFRDAAALWLESVAPGICPTTFRCYEQYVEALDLQFRNTPLKDICGADIQRYQVQRLEGDRAFVRKRRPQDRYLRPCPVRPRQVNHELQALARILTCADLSTGREASRQLALQRDRKKPPFALTEKEEQRWLDTCRSQARWGVLNHYTVLCLDACLDVDEARTLRLADVDLTAGTLTISQARNRKRCRVISLKGERIWHAVRFLVERAASLGASSPEHYLFPIRHRLVPDPTQPMTISGLKREWGQVAEASRMLYFDRRHLRPTGIVRYAERGMPLAELAQIAGELPESLKEHYRRVLREGPQQPSFCVPKPIPAFTAEWNQTPTFAASSKISDWSVQLGTQAEMNPPDEPSALPLPIPRDPTLQRLAKLLAEGPKGAKTLPALARKLGMSERSLYRDFQKETGLSPGQWRRRMKLLQREADASATSNLCAS